jgi:hypothetical protein
MLFARVPSDDRWVRALVLRDVASANAMSTGTFALQAQHERHYVVLFLIGELELEH